MAQNLNDQKIELTCKPKSCWEVYSSAADRKAMDALTTGYLDFLTCCKTERETVEYVVKRLAAKGFSDDPASDLICRPVRNKSVFIARRGVRPLSAGFRLIGAHCDSPRLDLKQRPLYEDSELGLAKTHYYGGVRKYQWLARPLALHGVIVTAEGRTIQVTYGEDPAEPVLTITDLLPHLAQKQSEQKVSDAFDPEKLNVVFGHSPVEKLEALPGAEKIDCPKSPVKERILEILYRKYGTVEADLMSAELQIVPAGPARLVGLDGAIIGGYGQDDRICVYAALEAFLAFLENPEPPEHTQLLLFWDKEEIGSEGASSARSLFFQYCLEDLIAAWEPTTRLSQVFQRGKAISADVNAAMDPDWPEVHDKLNVAMLGHGPCFSKYTGHRGKVGASDADAEFVAFLRGLLDSANIPWQMAGLGKVDLGGGGTVAKFLAVYGMDVIDCGPAILSMHSPFELSSKADLLATKLAYEAFLKS